MLDRIISEIEQNLSESENSWSIRFNNFWRYSRKDNNIFALASSIFIIKELITRLNDGQRQRLEKIIQNQLKHFSEYQNKDQLATYNFYKTQPSQHFPNGYLMQYFKHFKLPDDIDDSAIIYLCQNRSDTEVAWLQKHCTKFTNNIPSENSQKLQVYDTWFGKNMPKENDVCALLNLQYLFRKHALPITLADKQTLEFLDQNIKNICNKPFKIARHYAKSELIIYHYARYMAKFNELDHQKPVLIQIILDLLKTSKADYFQMLLLISLKKLNYPLDYQDINFDNTKFYSFIGAPFAPLKYAKFLASLPIFQIFWKSKIHELVLKLEYEMVVNEIKN